MTGIALVDPRVEAEPPAWPAYLRRHRLPGVWAYDVVAAAGPPRAPVLLGLATEAGEVAGVIAAAVAGRGRVGLLDVRLPGTRATPWHFAPGVDAAGRRRMLRAFERAAYLRLGPGIRGACYRAVPAADVPAVAGPGRLVRVSVPNTALDLPFASVDGWLATLTRSRRQDLRRQARIVAADPDLRVAFGFARTDLDPVELARLLREHAAGRAHRFVPYGAPLPPAYFARVLARPDVGILSYRDAAGRLLAFGTLLDTGDWAVIGWWAALDPSAGGRKHLYFDHYLRLVRWAIAHGRRGITGGRGLVAVKESLGFRPVPMHLAAAPRWLR